MCYLTCVTEKLTMPLLFLVIRQPDVDHSCEDCRNCTRTEKSIFVYTGMAVVVMTSMTKKTWWGGSEAILEGETR